MQIKKYISNLMRKLHLAGVTDVMRFYVHYSNNYFKNKNVQQKYPTFIFPPAYFIYETYVLNYQDYYADGLQTAKEISTLLSHFVDFDDESKWLLDWGCGPGRVVRHLPQIFAGKHKVFGCDYNQGYINWCSKNIPLVNFSKNDLQAPTFFSSDYFDAIYGLSIITHLSEISHIEWIGELKRILKPGGILLITSQGDAFKKKLSLHELDLFNEGKLVVREYKNEGQRVFAAFQPIHFMEELLKEFTTLKFIPGGSKESIHGLQDTWLLQKNY